MAVSLAVMYTRQDLLPAFWQVLRWLIPLWIVVLFAAQALVSGRPESGTPLDKLRNRLLRRKWSCPGCGRQYFKDVPIREDCAELRPEPDWTCEVCGTVSRATDLICRECKVPRPE